MENTRVRAVSRLLHDLYPGLSSFQNVAGALLQAVADPAREDLPKRLIKVNELLKEIPSSMSLLSYERKVRELADDVNGSRLPFGWEPSIFGLADDDTPNIIRQTQEPYLSRTISKNMYFACSGDMDFRSCFIMETPGESF